MDSNDLSQYTTTYHSGLTVAFRKPDAEHYNPILISVLPRERRARHPYQVGVMCWLILMSASQLAFGLAPNSSLQTLPMDQVIWLNYWCLFAGIAGLLAAVIPERVVRLGRRFRSRLWGRVLPARLLIHGRRLRVDFDATWLRLIDEGACHAALVFAWASYFVVVSDSLGLVNGLSFGSGAALCLCGAAAWRFGQIARTVYVPIFKREEPAAIASSSEVIGQGKGG